MYLVDFMDINNGMLLKTCSFEESIKIIVHQFRSYKRHQDEFKGKLFKHFENMWSENFVTMSNENWEDALRDVSNQSWSCVYCKELYDQLGVFEIEEANLVKRDLLINCPHKIVEIKSKWHEFGEMIKINIKSFWQVVKKFVSENKVYILLTCMLTLLPFMFDFIINYYKTKDGLLANSAEQTIKPAKRQVHRLVAQEYSQQNKDVEAKLIRNMANIS